MLNKILIKKGTVMEKANAAELSRLFEAVLGLETEEECAAFFEDICTLKEMKDLSQRLEVAQMLRSQATYTEIVEKTGVSTATIGRVNRALNYGAGGYPRVLEKCKGNTDK